MDEQEAEVTTEQEEQHSGPSEQEIQAQQAEEDRARLSGWTPKNNFRGDESRWVDAKTWNERADNLMPILKATNRRLEDELGATKKELSALQKTLKQVVQVNERVSEREYNRALDTIRKEQAKAVSDGDSDRFMELERQKDQLERPEKIEFSERQEQAAAPDDFVREWDSKNTWFQTDMELRRYAMGVAQDLQARGEKDAKRILEEVEKETKRVFAHKFSRQSERTVDSGGDRPAPKKSGKKGYDDLPKDAKNQCDKLVKDVPGYTREQYIKDYFEGED